MLFHLLQRKSNIFTRIPSSKFPIKFFILVLLPYQVHLSHSNSGDTTNKLEKQSKIINKMAFEQFAKNSYAFGADLYKVSMREANIRANIS